jgi:NAD-dependent dihydropyrimidine dehydrogenase PreA subunit
MSTRTIIEIDQERCNGCGACETGCPEGALKVIDGKARLVGESLCDGLGACIGRCPLDAIRVVEREAEGYDEIAVIKEILPQGAAVIAAHFAHLDHHGQDLYLNTAAEYLRSQNIALPQGFERFGAAKRAPAFFKPCGGAQAPQQARPQRHAHAGGCPGSAERTIARPAAIGASAGTAGAAGEAAAAALPAAPSGVSALANWPIQLHLANPRSPHFEGADVLIAADCTAFALGSFHADLLSGRALVIACTKLDSGRDLYLSKLTSIIAQARSVTVAIMEVPCCSGLAKLAQEAREASGADTPIEAIVVGIDGGLVAKKRI